MATTNHEYKLNLTRGGADGSSSIHKFGYNPAVGTSFVPVSVGGIYATPQVSGATTLRIKAGGNALDDASGSGARKIRLQGLNQDGALITEDIATNGISASAATNQSFIRLFRAFVLESGTYANASAGSHAADITVEASGGTQDWAVLSVNSFPMSQSEIAAYSVPKGFQAFVWSLDIEVDSNKSADVIFFKRESILDAAAPYQAMRVQERFDAVTADIHQSFMLPYKFDELTDFGFMAKTSSGTAAVSVEFLIELRRKD